MPLSLQCVCVCMLSMSDYLGEEGDDGIDLKGIFFNLFFLECDIFMSSHRGETNRLLQLP